MHNRPVYKETLLAMIDPASKEPEESVAEKYRRLWGIELPFDPSRDYARHEEVRALFEEAAAKRRKAGQVAAELQFFLAAYPNFPEARAYYVAFLHDVFTCPEPVLRIVREYINPPRNIP